MQDSSPPPLPVDSLSPSSMLTHAAVLISQSRQTLHMKNAFFLAVMLLGVVSKADNQLRDYPACGFRNEDSTIHPFIPEQVQRRDECLWDCTWVPNPLYRANWTVQLTDEYLINPDPLEEKVVFKEVNYFMMTPKIPKDLTCLDGCRLQEVVS